ncbi:hypothetical protein PV11_00592 [Exophiala sideris]|uniref:NCS1 nucleoside transporter n=1 Tax=Exophiala sideris TaxID=1016849 RepID=A0A0D1YPW2_9EURO|nr:hypothetical protein PV11_00592 [Exophiala sideris]
MEQAKTFTRAFKSREAFKELVRTDAADSPSTRWINNDLRPTPPERRTWTWYHLPLFWSGLAFGTTGWNIASSLIAVGLQWKHALAASLIGSALAGVVVTVLARVGARYHIGYPVFLRSVVGMYGSWLFVFLRLMTGLFWFGIQTYSGANLISTCLLCMFGHRWRDLRNTLPESADISTKQLICFFIAWLLQVPFFFVHPSRIQWFFTFKGIIMPIATFALFGWCMAEGNGISTIDNKLTASADGVPLGWAIVAGINTIMGSLASLIVTQPDLSRYCRKVSDAGWLQGLCVFISKCLVFFLGLAATASIQGVWGKAYWNIWDLLDAILDHYWTAGARCAVFLVSFAFYCSAIGSNIGTNTIAFGADLTGIIPKYMTIVRGQVLCCVLGVVMVPWKILASAQAFVTFLGSMPIFFGPLAALMIVDYYWVRRGNLHTPSLFRGKTGDLYFFTKGFNLRGYFAWLAGFLFGLPGMIGKFHPTAVNEAAKNMYRLGWPLTFTVTGVIYAVLVYFFPVPIYPQSHANTPITFEYLGKRDGFFEDDVDDDLVDIEGVEAALDKAPVVSGEKC